ncbi:hypothetical protein TIFTF001_056472 [Ficus carica]|uniref:Uncharacterized protein n=1 Tax=Ficus carica TaxID=3494 RepID=A0AA88EJ31_FICCA|nr:hypothetical protein TIFTF001_056472 [Ficus carica]
MAWLIMRWVSTEVATFRFSTPSGRPTSEEGKWRAWILMWWPELTWRSMEFRKIRALAAVVTTVTATSCMEKSLPKSTMGIMWPANNKGRKKTLSCSVSDLEAMF